MNINQMIAAIIQQQNSVFLTSYTHSLSVQLPLFCAIATVATPSQFITQPHRQFLRIAEV